MYIYGDGAEWIRKGLEEIPNAKYVMDGYHFEKALRSAAGCFPKMKFAQKIHNAIENGDKGAAEAIAEEMTEQSGDEKVLKRISNFKKYIE